jgi:hypothetical protein
MPAFTMNFYEKTTLTVAVTASDTGNTFTNLGVVPTWTIDNPNLAVLAPARDGRTCDVFARAPGTITVTCKLVKPDGTQAQATFQIVISAAVGDTLTLSASRPVRQ